MPKIIVWARIKQSTITYLVPPFIYLGVAIGYIVTSFHCAKVIANGIELIISIII